MANGDKLSLKPLSQHVNLTTEFLPPQFRVDESSFTMTSQLVERVIYNLPDDNNIVQTSNILDGKDHQKYKNDISTIFKGPIAPFNNVLIEG